MRELIVMPESPADTQSREERRKEEGSGESQGGKKGRRRVMQRRKVAGKEEGNGNAEAQRRGEENERDRVLACGGMGMLPMSRPSAHSAVSPIATRK